MVWGLGMRLSTSIISITRVEVVTQNAGCERPIKYLALLPPRRGFAQAPHFDQLRQVAACGCWAYFGHFAVLVIADAFTEVAIQ